MSQMPNPQMPPARSGSNQLVIIAVVVAFVAVILMNVYVEMRAKASALNTENFFKLKVDRDRGDELTSKDVQMIAIPVNMIQAFGTDAVKEDNATAGMPAGGYAGRIFSVSAQEGEILRYSMFVRGTSDRLGIDLAPGRRLFTIQVDSKNQPPNLAPDDYIDLYANIQRRTGTQSMVIMEKVQVRMVGNRVIESGADASQTRNVKYGTITVEVDQSEVRKLADLLTRVAGNQFTVVIRGASDNRLQLEQRATVNPEVLDMLGLDYDE